MKRMIVPMALFLLLGSVSAFAQGGPGGFQRRTVEERVKMIHQKMDSAFKLEAAKLTQVDSVFANYYRSQDKIREEMMSGGGQVDRQAMREKFQPVMDERDKKLQGILSADQYKTWKEVIEPSMRPQGNRGGGGGNGR
jgi:hypothetical protein